MIDETKFSMALELPTKSTFFTYIFVCRAMPTKIIGEVTKRVACVSPGVTTKIIYELKDRVYPFYL